MPPDGTAAMPSFLYEALPSRVVFGAGALRRLGEELERLGSSRTLVLTTARGRRQAEEALGHLGATVVGIFDKAVMHVPVATARAAREEARRLGADSCLAIGGGSTIGLGKAIALQDDLPLIAVPTTYAGSEVTPIWGLTEAGVKRTGRDPKVLPKSVLYDPELTLSLPAAVAGPSGMNALAHCVEALYAENANPIVSLMAAEGIRALAESLPAVVRRPGDLEARGQALYGAWLAGTALGSVGMALHHKLCHTLGGSFGLPHAEVHTVILPHATAYNSAAAPGAMRTIARALDAETAAGGLHDLAKAIGAPLSLRAIGMAETDLDAAAEIASRDPYYNPRPIERGALRDLLQAAYDGHRP